MKIRTGFVSNSSSASFVIKKDCLTDKQIKQIKSGQLVCLKFGFSKLDAQDYWKIEETDTAIFGSTIMDNFDMFHYLTVSLKINEKDIRFYDVVGTDRYGDDAFEEEYRKYWKKILGENYENS